MRTGDTPYLHQDCSTFPSGHPLHNVLGFCLWTGTTGDKSDTAGPCNPGASNDESTLCIDHDQNNAYVHTSPGNATVYKGCGLIGDCDDGQFMYSLGSSTTQLGDHSEGRPVVKTQLVNLSTRVDVSQLKDVDVSQSHEHIVCQQIDDFMASSCNFGSGPCPELGNNATCLENYGPESTVIKKDGDGNVSTTKLSGCSIGASDDGSVKFVRCNDDAYIVGVTDDFGQATISVGDPRGIHTIVQTGTSDQAKPNRWYASQDCRPQRAYNNMKMCSFSIYDGSFLKKQLPDQFSPRWGEYTREFNKTASAKGDFTKYTCPEGYKMQLHSEKYMWRCLPLPQTPQA